MYNEGQKLAFIGQYASSESSRKTCVSAFNTFAPFEEELGADICTLSESELQTIIDKRAGVRLHSARNRINVLKHYARWCIENKIPGARETLLKIKVGDSKDATDSLKQSSVASPKQLMRNLNKIFEPESMETVDNTLRCACWLVYGGVFWRWVQDVKPGEVDLENMEVVHNGVPSIIYREALPSVRNCIELRQFRYNNDHYGADVVCYRDRVDCDQLIRGLKTQSTYFYVADKLSKKTTAAKKHDDGVKPLSLTQIWLSGVFYRTYELEIDGVQPSFADVARFLYEVDYLGRKKMAPLGVEEEHKYIRDKARRLMNDYNRWKETF